MVCGDHLYGGLYSVFRRPSDFILMIEPIKADLMLSDTQFSLLQGLAFSLFYAFMGVPIAALADKNPV